MRLCQMSFRDSLNESVNNAFCTALGTINNFNDWFAQLPFGDSNIARGVAENVYRSVCNREPPPEPPPPFTGGQCPKRYYVALDIMYDGDSAPGVQLVSSGTNSRLLWGPITGFNIINSGSSSTLVCQCRGDGSFPGANQSYAIYSVGYNGSNIMGIQSYNILALTPYDGSPDDCGDPPPIIPPRTPNYNTSNTTINYNDYSNNSVDVDVSIQFGGPQLTFNGDVNIPVRIFSPDSNIAINGNFSVNNPTFNFDFGDTNYNTTNNTSNGSDYGTPQPPPPVPVDVPVPVLPPTPDNPDVETTRTIRAVIVTVTDTSDNESVIFQDGNPDIYVPNFGYINFLCQIGQSVAWTVDLPVKNKRNLVVCPWEGGAISVRGTPRTGVSWTLTEVFAIEEKEVSFEV